MTVQNLLVSLTNVPLDTPIEILMNGATPTKAYEVDGAYHVQNKKLKSKKFVIDIFIKSRKSPDSAKRSK